MAIKTFSTYAAYLAAKATLTAADTVTVKDNALTPVQVAALGKDGLVDTIRVSPITLNVAQFTAAVDKLNKLDTITVSDKAANINKGDVAKMLATADKIAPSAGAIQLTVDQAVNNLAKIDGLISVVDTSANIQSKLGTLFSNQKIKFINSSEDGVAITLTPAQAVNSNSSKLNNSDTIVVTGGAAAIQANLDALLKNAKVDSIISDGGALRLTVAQATDANLQKLNGTSTLNVVDASSAINSASNVKLVSLLANAKVDSINSTDDAAVPLKLNAAQAVAAIDAGTLVKIQSTDALTIVDSSANIQANLSKLLANAKIDSINSFTDLLAINLTADQVTTANMLKLQLTDNIAVVDTGANIQAKLAALLANPKIDTITTSDASALTLKAAAAVSDSAAKISGTIAVSDTSAAINANLDALLADAKVASINSSQDATAITLTATQALNAANMDKLQAGDNIVVALTAADSALTADQITALNALVGGKVDSIENVYTLSAANGVALVSEGNGLTFTVTAVLPVSVDTVFSYGVQGTTTGPAGVNDLTAASAGDLTPTAGTVTMLAGQSTATFTIAAVNDGLAEFNEGAVLNLRNASGTALIASQTFVITDGSSYTLVADAASANEGSMATFTLNTVNVADDTVLTYTLSGTNIDASDIVGGSLTGTTTVTGGVATIDVQLASDLKTEGAETLKVTVEGEEASAVINDTSLDATYTLVADQATANEGANATFTLTSNAPVGSVVDYTIGTTGGITAADVTGGLLTGQATLGAGGTATITVPLALDSTTEGAETLTVDVHGQMATTSVVDTSITPVLATDAVTGTLVNGQGTAIINATTIASWLANDKDTTGAVPTGAVTIDMNSAVNGQLIALTSGDTAFIANAGQRQGSFSYSVAGITNTTGTVNVTINADPVVQSGTTLSTAEDTAATGTITVTDSDSDALTYTFANGAHGTVVAGANGTYTYTPAANYNGSDTISVSISDPYTTITQDIAVTVTSVNDDPQAITPVPSPIAVKAGQDAVTVDLTQYATDPDLVAGDTTGLTFTVPATTAKGGVITLNGHTATIAYPEGGGSAALGTDTFAFTVKDSVSAAIPATVTLNITNTAPVANSIGLTAKTGVTQTIDLVAGTSTQGSTVTNFTSGVSDADGNTLTPVITVGSLSSGGSAEVVDGKIVYTSTIGFVGTETLKYTLSDGFGGTSTEQTLTFTVASNTGGTSGNDLLYGSTAAENIDGLAGNDTIVGGGGLDTITGGDGNDQVTFSDAAVQIQGGAGVDTLVLNADAVASTFELGDSANQNQDTSAKNSNNQTVIVRAFENIDASKSSGDFILNSNSTVESYATTAAYTTAASPFVEFGDVAQTTSVKTGSGNDKLNFGAATGTVTVQTNDGNDIINVFNDTTDYFASGKFSIEGGAGNDTINVTDTTAAHTIVGGAGNDTVTGGTGVASITGGDGNDTITNGNTTGTISGDAGDDNITGSASAETLQGGDGNDTITSGGANDSINAGAGDDKIDMAANALSATVSIDGGTGTDTLAITTNVTAVSDLSGVSDVEILKSEGAASTVTLAGNKAGLTTIDISNSGDQVVTFNTGYTAATTVIMTGDASTNTDKIVNSANTALTIVANAADIDGGTTTITGGTGTDVLQLKADSGTAMFSTTVTGVETVTVVDNGDSTTGSTTLAGEDITLNLGSYTTALTIDGSALDAGIKGAVNATDEILTVTGGSATGSLNVTGGAGADSITVGTGIANVVAGNAGNDAIIAGAATDNLSGGTGDDTFTLAALLAATTTVMGGEGNDTLSVTSAVASSAVFANVSGVETLKTTNNVTLASNISGLTTIDISDSGDQVITFNTGYTAATTVILTGDLTANADKVINSANTALTVDANSADVDATTTITGGTGNDILQLKADGDATGADFTNVTLVETVTVVDGGDKTATADNAGKDIKITLGAYATALTVNASALDAADSTATDTTAETLTLTSTGSGALSVTGGAGNDSITGGTGNDTILGSDGEDSLAGGTGTNSIEGGAGNDTITGTGTDNLKGGDGDDKFIMAATLTSADAIDGGTGTNTVQIAGTIAAASELTGLTNIASLEVTGANSVTLAANTSVTTFNFSDTGDQTLTLNAGYTAATTVVLTGDATGNADKVVNTANVTLTVTANAADVDATTTITGGTGSDVLSLTADNGTSDLTAVTKVDTITVVDNGDTTAKAGKDITINTGVYTTTLTIDGSALDAGVSSATDTTDEKLTVNGALATGALSVTGGAGADSVIGGTAADTINGGTGADYINGIKGLDQITTGSGADLVAVNSNSNVLTMSTVVDFASGDALFRSGKGTETFNATKLSLIAGATLSDYVNAAAVSATAATDSIWRWFQYGSDTFVVVDSSNNTSFTTGTDAAIQLSGLFDLSTGWTFSAANDTLTYGSSATTTTGTGNILIGSASSSLVGSDSNDTFMIARGDMATSTISGAGGTDTIQLTAETAALVDADFANFTTVEKLALTGANTATLGTNANTAGLTTVVTGAGATSLTFSSAHARTVDAAALADGTTLTLNDGGTAANITVTNLIGDLTVNDAHTGNVAVTLGAVATSTVAFGTNTTGTHTVNADALTDAQVLTLTGSDDATVTLVGGDLTASAYAGKLTVTATTGTNVITTGSADDTITGGTGVDNLDGAAGNDVFAYATSADFITTGGTGAVVDTITGGADTTGDKIQISGAIAIQSGDSMARVNTVEQLVAATASGSALTESIVLNSDAAISSIRTIDLSGETNASSTGNIVLTGVTVGTALKGVNGGGNNTITGGAGIDTITGGAGADILDGAGGVDKFVVNFASAATPTASSKVGAMDEISSAASDSVNFVDTDGTAVTIGLGANNTTGATTLNTVDVLSNNGVVTSITKGDGTTANALTIGTSTEVDTLAKVLALLNTDYATDGDTLYVTYGADSYLWVQNGAADVVVKLVGVTGDTTLTDTSDVFTWS